MLEFLFGKKKEKEVLKSIDINDFYSKIKNHYKFDNISDDRKNYLKNTIEKYGYLPYPHVKALEELSIEETLFGLELKWLQNGIFKNGRFEFDNNQISVLSRNHATNSEWIQKEGHDIKLINLAGLGNGNITKETGKFFDWLKQLLILPTGNLENNIFNTTIYLIPFHPREFGCAYLPKSSDVSESLLDKNIQQITGMDAKEQVKTFITLAQLAGHPVIYDILPQTGRFSKAVLANPEIARWFDITKLSENIAKDIDKVAEELSKTTDPDDIEVIKNIYKQSGGNGDLTEHYQEIYNKFDSSMNDIKKKYSNAMLLKANQAEIHKRVRGIVAKILGAKQNKNLTEHDITKQIDIIQELIKEGLWPAPGGAWCSAGIPV